MSFVTAEEMRALEESAFRRGVSADTLMDLAGEEIGRRLAVHFPVPGTVIAYLGKGNNAGDALVALRFLRAAGWKAATETAAPQRVWTAAARRRMKVFEEEDKVPVQEQECSEMLLRPASRAPLLLLDGLLGIGAKGPIRAPFDRLAAKMQALRESHGAVVVAIDLPSGMDADTGEGEAVTADLTVTVGAPKKGLGTDAGVEHSGRILLVPLAELPPPESKELELFCPDLFPGLLPPRAHDFHKGNAGRLGIVAGSPGMAGAAIMSATAALHMGAGLIVLHVDRATREAFTAPLPPEVMVKVSDDPVKTAFEMKHDALVIGPGWGEDEGRLQGLLGYLETSPLPCLLDADALNGIAYAGKQSILKPQHLVTPHPGEFKRLAEDLAELPRQEAARKFVERYGCTLLLKGARTLVAAPGKAVRLNPTGHAGMASGGQGDALSGVGGALLAGGVSGIDAAALAAWLCGRAAERALENGPYTTASDTVRHLGGAVLDWQRRAR